MRALCWMGVNDLQVHDVPDPVIVNLRDAILKVRLTTTCGSDLHLLGGSIPTMREGDVIGHVIGHEYMGEVVETGPETTGMKVGDRVVVPSFLGCGKCWYCDHDYWSLCDNTHPKPELQEPLLGYPTGGIPGYSHAFGGYAGSHAQYIRVPHADANCFVVPEGVTDEQALIAPPWPTGPPRLRQLLLPAFASYQLLVSAAVLGPRTMTAGRAFVRGIIRAGSGPDARWSDAELDLYANVLRHPARAAASSACYRTFLTRELPATLRGGDRSEELRVPSLLLMGAKSALRFVLDPRPAPNLQVETVACAGHFLPEEAPAEVLARAVPFLARSHG